jgi:predicted MFS family arabinose efflux permease
MEEILDTLDKKEDLEPKHTFTRYQKFMIAILAFLQFTVILDFMVLSPLSFILLKEMQISPKQFGMVVSAYAISAGLSGLLAAGFADKFDRKKFLMFFYVGFLGGTIFCAMAPTYEMLLAARIVTGIFGGVIGSVGFAIIGDLFALEVRGRVMGFVQMAFAASQILGLPIGLLLANEFTWHAPFWMIVGFGVVAGVIMVIYMKPIDAHLKIKSDRNAFQHLGKVVSNTEYLKVFLGTVLLATGGFMLMPFGSEFSTKNLGLSENQLPSLYFVTGIVSIAFGPFVGKLSDKKGKYTVFVIGSIVSIVMVLIYTQMGVTPLWVCMVLSGIMFVGISSRIISSSALITAIPSMQDRGAFMSVNSSVQQISGGIATGIAGMIVVKNKTTGLLEHYDILGYVVTGSALATIGLMYIVHKQVQAKLLAHKAV